MRIKVFHVITGLGDGGAEGVLYRLIQETLEDCDSMVISLSDMGKYGSLINDLGVKVVCLNMQRGKINLTGLFSLYKFLKTFKPDVVQTWMHHADFVAGVLSYFLKVKSIYWNLRSAELHKKKTKKRTRMVVKACAMLSNYVPSKIVSCSNRAISVSLGFGYANNFELIPNGCNTLLFSPDKSYRFEMRKGWNVLDDYFVIGMIARYDPQKDHANLIKSFAIISRKRNDVKLILAGSGVDYSNEELVSCINKEGVLEKVILLGQQSNIPKVMNGLDIHVLSSLYGEAFPNVLTEAMSCGIPCVATDIGDSMEIISDCGWTVEAGSCSKLSLAIIEAYQMKLDSPKEWNELKLRCVNRVKNNFSLEKMVDRYITLWKG